MEIAPVYETQMVDYRIFEDDPSCERRNELMRNVSTLLAIASESCTHEQIDIYDSVLSRLADMVEVEARAFAARKIAPLRRAPAGIVKKLARDNIAVASPILAQSPVLTDGDLIDVIMLQGTEHLRVVADRQLLSDRVTDAIILKDDKVASRKVVANPGALISDEGFKRLGGQAVDDAPLASALSDRSDTPDAVIRKLVEEATEAVRLVLTERGEVQNPAKLDSAGRLAAERMSNGYWLGLYDFESAYARLLSLGGTRLASEELMVKCALDDRFPDVVAVFAVLASVSLDEAKHWLVRADLEPFLVVARAINLKPETVQILLRTGPWRHRLQPHDRSEAMTTLQCIQPEDARRSLLFLRRVG